MPLTTAVDNGPVYTEVGPCYVASRPGSPQLLTKDDVINESIMAQNYPNPFRTITSIRYALPAEANVSFEVYNQVGQRVAILAEGRKSAGYHQAKFDATKLAAGIYIYRLLTVAADGKPVLLTKKMIVAK